MKNTTESTGELPNPTPVRGLAAVDDSSEKLDQPEKVRPGHRGERMAGEHRATSDKEETGRSRGDFRQTVGDGSLAGELDATDQGFKTPRSLRPRDTPDEIVEEFVAMFFASPKVEIAIDESEKRNCAGDMEYFPNHTPAPVGGT